MMIKNKQQVAQQLANIYERTNLIFHAVLAPPLVVFVWLYLESRNGNVNPILVDQSIINQLSFGLPFLILGLIVIAFLVFKLRLKRINQTLELVEKIKNYWQQSIILFAILDAGLILSVLGYYICQKDVFVAMYVTVLIFFSLYKPTLERAANHLNIKGEEREFLTNCRDIGRREVKDKIINK